MLVIGSKLKSTKIQNLLRPKGGGRGMYRRFPGKKTYDAHEKRSITMTDIWF